MKKTMMQLAVTGMVLACATAVFAATQTRVFMVFDGYTNPITGNITPPTDLSQVERGIHANLYGYVTFKTSRGGGVDITVQVRSAAKSYEYVVKSNRIEPWRFKTNNKGVGSLTIHVADPSALGSNINLWTGDYDVFTGEPIHIHLFYAGNPLYTGGS
jgi:hypothetical protein